MQNLSYTFPVHLDPLAYKALEPEKTAHPLQYIFLWHLDCGGPQYNPGLMERALL